MKSFLVAGAMLITSFTASAELINVNNQINIGVLELEQDFKSHYYGNYDLERSDGILMYLAKYQDTIALITNIDATREYSGDDSAGSIFLTMSSDLVFGDMIWKDDPDEGISENRGNEWEISWGWAPYWRDGMIFEFSTQNTSIDLNWTRAHGIDTYHFLSFDGNGEIKAEYLVDNNLTINLAGINDLSLNITTGNAESVPVAPTGALMGLAIAGLAFRRKQ